MPSRRVQAARHVGLLARCPAQSTVPAFDETSASSFAFLTNVYAAYIWPTKLLAHDRFATLCWRGHVERRKRAFMPLEVANYLGEVLGEARDCGKVIAHDLSDFIVSDVMLHDLRRAAERRLHANGIAFTYRSPIGRWACGRLRWL